ncbi:hypothetical protein [Actinomadura sp. 6N118]|uniref:hypothetical protein n=1 Tax=Actinomadura sp. 6N118 TaxID=3375151 RepID=UPI0037ACA45A
MSLFITTIGAVLTTLLGVLVGSVLSSRAQQRQRSHDRQLDACAQVLRESSNMLIELALANGEQGVPAPDGVNVKTTLDWKAWNEALAMVNLVADRDIVQAAHAIDAEFWPVHLQIKRGWTTKEDWPRLRTAIDTKRQDFVNIARTHLAAEPGPPLRRLTGRPPADHPIWQFRRSYFTAGES